MAFSIVETTETTETTTPMTGTAGDLAALAVIAAGGPWPDGEPGENDRVEVEFTDSATGDVLFQYDQGQFDMIIKVTTIDEETV